MSHPAALQQLVQTGLPAGETDYKQNKTQPKLVNHLLSLCNQSTHI